MKISEKIEKIKGILGLLEYINSLCSDIKIITLEGNVDYYCSEVITQTASDIEVLEPSYGLPGHYRCLIYKDYYVSEDPYYEKIRESLSLRTTNKTYSSTIRIYGIPLMIDLFDVNLNKISFLSYEDDLGRMGAPSIIKNKIDSYIINFISKNNVKIDQDKVPNRVKSLLAFT